MRRTPMMAGLVIASMALSANPVAAHPDLGLSEDGLVPIPMPMSNDDIIVIDVAQVDEDFLFVGGVSETGEQVVRHVDLPPFAGPGDPEADVRVNEILFEPPPGAELAGVEYDPYSDTAVVIGNVFPEQGSTFPYLMEVSFDDPMTTVIDLGDEPYVGILAVDFFEGGRVFAGVRDSDGDIAPGLLVEANGELTSHQVGGRPGFFTSVVAGPGPDQFTGGAVILNRNNVERSAALTFNDGAFSRVNLPIGGDRLVDLQRFGDTLFGRTVSGENLMRPGPDADWTVMEHLTGARILAVPTDSGLPPGPAGQLTAFGPGGLSHSFDAGKTWANQPVNGFLDGRTVKGYGLWDGRFTIFSGDDAGHPQLHTAPAIGLSSPPDPFDFDGAGLPAPVDTLDDYARQFADRIVDDVEAGSGSELNREIADAVLAAVSDRFDERLAESQESTGDADDIISGGSGD